LHFLAKARGLLVLERVMQKQPPDACILFSSNASILGGLGSTAYSAANIFMDAFAQGRKGAGGIQWISANWDGWLADDQNSRLAGSFQTSLDQYAMSPAESIEAFKRAISLTGTSQVVVSTGDLDARLNLWVRDRGKGSAADSAGAGPPTLHPRPALGVPYVAPQSELEKKIAGIWEALLGVAQLGIHDNFFDLGGNSLICLKVVSQLKKELKLEIPVVAIFEGPTVSSLARLVGNDEASKPSYEESRSRGERRREKRARKQKGVETA
jgi:acyl carrier protein